MLTKSRRANNKDKKKRKGKKSKNEKFYALWKCLHYWPNVSFCGPAFDDCISSFVGWSGQSKPSIKRQPSASRRSQVLAQRPESSGNFYARWESAGLVIVSAALVILLILRHVSRIISHCRCGSNLLSRCNAWSSVLFLSCFFRASGAIATVKWSSSFVTTRTLLLEWLPCACVQTRLGHPVVHWHHYTPRPLQSKHGRYEWPGRP